MALPNFIVLGIAKAGTTSLYHYLGQHPDVGMSKIQEPRYLIQAGMQSAPERPHPANIRVSSLADYHAQYSSVADRKARGDISPHYFFYPELTILGIQQVAPDARIITIFRQPADRAYSNYLMRVRRGDEPIPTFAKALDAEKTGIPYPSGRKRHYGERSFYVEAVNVFLDALPQNRFLYLMYDDLMKDPQALLRQVFAFLEVDPNFQPNVIMQHNTSSWPKNFSMHRLLRSVYPYPRMVSKTIPYSIRRALAKWVESTNFQKPPKLDLAIRRELTSQYKEDILRLQDIIHRDLSGWLRDPE